MFWGDQVVPPVCATSYIRSERSAHNITMPRYVLCGVWCWVVGVAKLRIETRPVLRSLVSLSRLQLMAVLICSPCTLHAHRVRLPFSLFFFKQKTAYEITR